jgi:hypothetical protein
MKRVVTVMMVGLLALGSGASAQVRQSIKGREILGLRIGGVYSTSGLHEYFGAGTELEIYFYHGITHSSGIGVSLSGHNFGKSLDPAKDLEYLGIPVQVDYMIYSLTANYMVKTEMSPRVRVSGEVGGGLYTSRTEIPVGGMTSAGVTYNMPGLYAGSEIWWRLTKGGIHLGLGAKWHYVFSGTDYRQPIYIYTGKDYAHWFQFTIGISFLTDD